MSRSSAYAARWSAAFALLAIVRSTSVAETAHPRLVIRIYDGTGASREGLAVAGKEALRILRDAGVDSEWVDCGGRWPESRAEPACGRPAGPLDVVLKILRRRPEGQTSSGETMGFSVVPSDGSPGVLAGVFFDQARLAAPTRAWTFRVVGLLAAHEIGHLLLGPESHSGAGIMRERFHERRLNGVSWGDLRFSRSEAERMRDALRRRLGASD